MRGKIQPSEKRAEERDTFGKNLSFAAAEAYKLLRTNLLFALPDEQKCRIVGLTSSFGGEGKSTTSLNLAYMLAESGRKVLVIEGDMRLPTVSRRLELNTAPGLSNLLAGLNTVEETIQPSGLHESLWIMASGDIPPNPSELLGSPRMETALEKLAPGYDFVILDLPPVNAVADALVVARLTKGILMVVRQGYASRRSVAEAMRQLQYAGVNVLGFVVTCSDKLSKNKDYKKYGYEYGPDGKAHTK